MAEPLSKSICHLKYECSLVRNQLVLFVPKKTVHSNIFTESCDRYMIQQNGGSGIQFMETDMLTFGNYMCEP